jgi:ubiquitin-protein ligase
MLQQLKDFASVLDYRDLQYSAVSGLYVLPDPCDSHLWHGVVSARVGAYKGGSFRFHLRLAANHPADGAYPELHFLDDIFHPLVDSKVCAIWIRSEVLSCIISKPCRVPYTDREAATA